MDLKTGVIVFVGRRRGGNALKPFWTRVRDSKTQVRAVDMSSVCYAAVPKHLPQAVWSSTTSTS